MNILRAHQFPIDGSARHRRIGPSALRLRRSSAAIAALGFTAALMFAGAAPATAHDTLQSSDPAADTTVTVPLDSVALTFGEDLLTLGGEANGFAIQIIDVADGNHLEEGCVEVAGQVAEARVALPQDGEYEVRWQVVSSDGHPISGTYRFGYATGESLEVRSIAAPPACGEPWAGSEPAAEPTTEPTEEASESPTATETATESEPAETPEPDASAAPQDAEDGASDSAEVPLWAVVIGGLGVLGAGTLVILVALRRQRNQP